MQQDSIHGKQFRLYGIPNCDTVKKARKWLAGEGVAVEFHDFRKDGLDAGQLAGWCDRLGWERLLNRRGTTWRKLPEEQRDGVDASRAIALMLEQPALIKRPVIEYGDHLLVGFDAAALTALLAD